MFKQNFEMAFGQVIGATTGFVVVAGIAYICYKASNNSSDIKKDDTKKPENKDFAD